MLPLTSFFRFAGASVRITGALWSVAALTLAPAFAQSGSNANPVVVGDARFTVVTPYCIRMEYQAGAQFVDAPSLFAAERGARTARFRLTQSATQAIIDTGAIRLTYTPDGKPFDAANLSATIMRPTLDVGAGPVVWTQGEQNSGNLGGTLRTLDGATGPEDLGQGVLSRSGWAIIDDSQTPLLTPGGWAESRPDAQKQGIDEYLFGYGDNFRAALSSLTAVSGAVPMPRRYLMGVWYSRYWPWSDKDYHQIVDEYAAHDFPLDNIVLDMDWHKDGWTGWSWNTKLLPDAPALLAWFHSQGLHDTLNLHPADGVAPHEDQYATFMKALGEDPASRRTVPFDAGDPKYMDALFSQVLTPLRDAGVDFWWLDWQQYPDTRSVPDLTNLFWLNTLLYRYTEQQGQRGVSFSRWAGWGDQRHPIHFSGDADTGFPMLAFEVPFTSTAGNVGCFFWSHDIGGHMGGRNPESYARWCQFGATAPVLRSHSTRDPLTDRRPWNYPKWAEDSMRVSFHLRSRLFPYLYTGAAESCRESVPLDRPLYLDAPRDENSYHNGQEFLLGDNVLIAPIAMKGVGPGRVGWQPVYFPPQPSSASASRAAWYNLFTGERYVGGTHALIAADIDEFPIYARGGVPIPMQDYTPRMGTHQIDHLRLRCYPGPDGAPGWSSLYEDDGTTNAYKRGTYAQTLFTYIRSGTTAIIRISAANGNFVGQPASRSITIELPDTLRASRAMMKGSHSITLSYDAATCTNFVVLPAQPVAWPITVVVTGVTPAGWDALHRAAISRRLDGALGRPVGAAASGGVAQLRAALAEASTPIQQTAVLAVYGIGLIDKNQATYFYPARVQQAFYTPTGMLAGQAVTLSNGSKQSVMPGWENIIAASASAGVPVSVDFQAGGMALHLPNDLVRSAANIAPLATASASSVQGGSVAAAAIDRSLSGYPADATHEWASSGEKAGAWLRLDWSTAQTIDQVQLFDRPNSADQMLSATITFSDGSSVAVGALPNDGSEPAQLSFAPKTVTWLKVTVTKASASTVNVGLSEIAVRRAGNL